MKLSFSLFLTCFSLTVFAQSKKEVPVQTCACQQNVSYWSVLASLNQHRRLGFGLGISRNHFSSSRGLGGGKDYYASALYWPSYQKHQQKVWGAKIGYNTFFIIAGVGGELVYLNNSINSTIAAIPQVSINLSIVQIKYGYVNGVNKYNISELGRHSLVFSSRFHVYKTNNFAKHKHE
jgi:hypothetical protein